MSGALSRRPSDRGASAPDGAALLEVDGLRRSFGGVVAVADASFGVRAGSLTGLIGPNGAGKSTVLDMVAGTLTPTAGSIRFAGRDLAGLPPHRVGRMGLIRVFQRSTVFGRLTVLENLLVGEPTRAGETALAAIGPKRRWRQVEQQSVAKARELLARLDIAHLESEYAAEASGGQQRLIELARALMAEPRMLLLDEPLAGVSPPIAARIARHLEDLRDAGMTMLMVEHELAMVERLCDPVVVMANGRVVAEGTMAEVRARRDVVGAYLG